MFLFSETVLAQTALEFTMLPQLALNSQVSCLSVPSVEITDMHHDVQFIFVFEISLDFFWGGRWDWV
jgi:hypothetical protein